MFYLPQTQLNSMTLSFFFLVCPFFVLCTLGVLLLFSPQNKRRFTLQLFGLFLIIRAIIYISIAGCYYPPSSFQVFIESIDSYALLLHDPVLFFAVLSLIFPLKLILKRCWPLLVPAAVLGTIYLIAYLSYPDAIRQKISISFWNSEEIVPYALIYDLQLTVQITMTALTIIYLALYTKVLVFDFTKFLKNNYSNAQQLNIRAIIYIGVLFILFAFLYAFIPLTGEKTIIPIFIFEILLGFIIYLGLNNSYRINPELIENYMISFVLNTKNIPFFSWLFPYKSLAFLNKETEETSENQAHKTESLFQKLIGYFEEKKPYLQKDLSMDDIARALSSNRTYISQLLSKEKNISFYDFVNAYRVEEAKIKMQEQPSICLKFIAEECGFSSYTTFVKYFKEKELTTPNKWKTEQNEVS